MGIATGKPRGRPKGSLNKSSEKLQQALAEKAVAVEATLDKPFAGDSHGLLMSIYKDLTQPLDIRMEAAKAAIPYEKPRLASTEVRATMGTQSPEEALFERLRLAKQDNHCRSSQP